MTICFLAQCSGGRFMSLDFVRNGVLVLRAAELRKAAADEAAAAAAAAGGSNTKPNKCR
jgi:hypothetical protein